MRYGFIIGHRKGIGCHACTVACNTEHQVALGVSRYFQPKGDDEFPALATASGWGP